MSLRSIVLLLCCTALLGCGKTAENAGSTVVDVGSPKSINPYSEGGNATASPPGMIELPEGVDPAALSPGPRNSDGEGGGIVLPPMDAKDAPVIVQRPVLDDPAAAPAIPLTAASLDSILQQAAAAKKVCVVDVWSLSCEPCLKEFPGLVRLDQELGGKVTCLSVNVDYDGRKSKPAETYRSRVTAFLQSSNATFDNFLCETPNEEVYAALKIVSIPAVLIYDANGNLVRTFSDTGEDRGFNYAEQIAPLVRTLVTN